MKIKVLMADDHALFRDGMRYVLQQLADEVDILDSGNFQDALQIVQENPDIDLALLDLNMPGSEGIPSIQFFHLRHPDIPVVVVSGSDHRDDIESVMESGAMGFISKMSSSKIMLSALRMVLEGGVYLPPQLLQQAISNADLGEATVENKRAQRAARFGLTARQFEVLSYLAAGLGNKEISKKMNLAEGTVKIHTAAVYQALHVNSRLEAVSAARRLGFLPPAPNDSSVH
jgi:DNA-binding NarL/FixJ family response regulator